MNQQELLKAVCSNIESQVLPGAMWFVMLMNDREVQRPLTFLLTTRENNPNAIYHSITWTKSLDFVINISKLNARKFMENFSNFISILMEAKPEFFTDSSFTKIIESFYIEWGFPDDFIIALNAFFDERAMEPDYNPDEPIRWSYAYGNNAQGDLGIYNDWLLGDISSMPGLLEACRCNRAWNNFLDQRLPNKRLVVSDVLAPESGKEPTPKFINFTKMKEAMQGADKSSTKEEPLTKSTEVRRSSEDKKPVGAENPFLMTKEQFDAALVAETTGYGSCVLTSFKEAMVYFVDSLESLQQLEYDLGRKDIVQSPKRDMENWFIYPEPRGKTIRLNNFDFVVVLGRGEDKSPCVPVVTHEAMHVVLSLCKQIGYNPLNEQEPAAYAMEYLVKQALGFFALNEGAPRK